MRVVDLGSGVGHVAQLVASLIGPEGSVLGVEESAEALEVAETRRGQAGLANVRFVQGDVRTFEAGTEFDAVVGRLILFHLPDPAAVVPTISGHSAPAESSPWSTTTSAPRGTSRPRAPPISPP
jgi:tRNA A58 N-methylase Trm61